MACNLVVIVIVELVNELAADLIELLHKAVYVVVYCREAHSCIVAVRCFQVGGYAPDVALVKAVDLWNIVAERVNVADDEEQFGRNVVAFAYFGNGSFAEA